MQIHSQYHSRIKELVFYENNLSFSEVISGFNQIVATLIYTEIISRLSQPHDE